MTTMTVHVPTMGTKKTSSWILTGRMTSLQSPQGDMLEEKWALKESKCWINRYVSVTASHNITVRVAVTHLLRTWEWVWAAAPIYKHLIESLLIKWWSVTIHRSAIVGTCFLAISRFLVKATLAAVQVALAAMETLDEWASAAEGCIKKAERHFSKHPFENWVIL